ncbi:cation:H+ antiporter [Methanolobus vulcani]|jgi:K+-dependent Na+/Ca+ exchanger related-protein|uniref:Cation:H+ antiporter n=1 Tax=Methanolobus vulcani TaxID=38026 RepID=A0A7Z7B3H5_9EURY|nr:calcium/sodium antiporter [Methanolobus vulcani]SDG26400.1 cation:H+ antiporter [Methanolobus vulcani]
MLETVALLLVSLVMITKGADWFVESAVTISEKSGIPKIIIGATIVSFATTAPEFTVSAMAAYLNHVEMTVGNAVGSAICNIGLVLGGVIVIKAIPVELHGFTRKSGFMLGSALLLFAVSYDGVVSSFDGILLLLVFIGFLYYNYRLQSAVFDGNEEFREKVPLSQLKKDILLFIAGALLVVIGSRILVDAGITIAEWLGVPEMIIALTLVALGTSLPELITAVSATLKGHQDISIGNILGANTMDIALILGASSQIRPLTILPQSLNYDFPFMIALMIILIIFGITGKKLERWEGAIILGVYFGYVAGLFTLFN